MSLPAPDLPAPPRRSSARTPLAGVAVVVALFVWALPDLALLLGYAVLLAYALLPLVGALERVRLGRARLSRGVAAGVVTLALVVLAGALLVVAVPRLAVEPAAGHPLADLAAGASDAVVAAARGLPLATVRGLRSFYDQLGDGRRACDGTACRFGGGEALARRLARGGAVGTVRCLGHCYAAPSFRDGDRVFARPAGQPLEAWLAGLDEADAPREAAPPIPRRALIEPAVVLRNLVPGAAPAGLAEYELPGPERILAALEASRLRGRGGAAYPTAAKWRAARDAAGAVRWVVANGDEGDPGSYTDRLLLEEDPHAVLAGMRACALVIGARHGVLYIRGEYPRALACARAAVEAARVAGHLGAAFDVEVVAGAGSYVCGEETALLRSIETSRRSRWCRGSRAARIGRPARRRAAAPRR